MPKTLVPPKDLSEWSVESKGAKLRFGMWPSYAPALPVIIDVENNQDGSPAGIGMTQDGQTIWFMDAACVAQLDRQHAFKDYQLIGHNIKYDIQMLRKWGFHVSFDQAVYDTQLASYIKDSSRNKHGLKDLAREQLHMEWPAYKELCGTGKKAVSIGTLPLDILANYNGCDVLATYRLYKEHPLTDSQMRYMEEIELLTMCVLGEMEERGVQIDRNYVANLDNGLAGGTECVVKSIRDLAGCEINLNSPPQVKRLLVEKFGLKVPTTSAEVLKDFKKVPIVGLLLRYRELAKLKGTYTEVLLEASNEPTYRLHARFNQMVTNTGRLSSSGPNLQNIPSRTDEGEQIRGAFIAKEGHTLYDFDYSQIEPRLMAYFSGDKELKKIFLNGEDLYAAIATTVGLDPEEGRPIAKVLWLAMAYNAGAWKIGQKAGIPRNEAEVFLTRMKIRFKKFFAWRRMLIAQTEVKGYVETMFGRRIPLPVEFAHLAPNYKIQGTAAEVMKLGLISTRHYNPVLTVHDEILFELSKECDTDIVDIGVKAELENVVNLDVPLVVEAGCGPTWKEAKP